MAVETEIKLSLPPRAATRLAKHPLLVGIQPLRQRLLNTYYDTPDLRLQRERIAVRYRKKGWQWLFTVKCAAPSAGGLARRNEWEGPGLPGEFDFSHVDDKKLRHLLESLRNKLTPAFTTDFVRNAWLIEPQAGVRIELALDRGWIESKGRRAPICEVELELLEGDVDALFAAASALQADLPLHPEVASKAERGYRLFTDAALTPAKALPAKIDGDLSASAAFSSVAHACLNQLQSNERGLHESDDPEFVHQARVAIRRLRSAIRAWKPLLPTAFVADFDPRWRTLAAALGDARNGDVFITETLPLLADAFPAHPEIDRLAQHAIRRNVISRKRARRTFKAADYSRLLLEFTAATLALADSAKPSLKDFACDCLSKRARHVSKLAAVAHKADAAACHRLRVTLKRLRYALEFFAPLLPGQRMQSYHLAATQLQDLLGRMNDLAVAMQFTKDARPTRKAEFIGHWLEEKNSLMQQELNHSLGDFLKQKAPWKQR
jgi:inorganic triphosphatase YgiF